VQIIKLAVAGSNQMLSQSAAATAAAVNKTKNNG